MSEPLAIKYRPKEFADIIGQTLTAAVLNKMVESASVPPGLLFSGPSGTGKTTAARILGSKLNTELMTVELDSASNGGVADIRTLIENLRYGFPGEYRVIILDEAHSITRDGFNALLKTLEEPPSGTIFVFCSTEPEKIPETVKSRLIEFEFHRVSSDEIYDRLVYICGEESIQITGTLLTTIADDASGSVRKGVQLLDQCKIAGIQSVETYRKMSGYTDIAPELIDALSTGNAAKVDEVVQSALRRMGDSRLIVSQLTRGFRDLQVIRTGGKVSYTGEALKVRHDLAYRLEQERIFTSLKTLWDLKTRTNTQDDPLGSLDLALAMIGEVMTRGKSIVTPLPDAPARVEPVAVRRLTLAEMQEQK